MDEKLGDSDGPQLLNYARASSRQWKRVIFWSCAAVGLLVASYFGVIWLNEWNDRRLAPLRRWNAMMTFHAAGNMVLETDSTGGGSTMRYYGWEPTNYPARIGFDSDCFVHGLTIPGGAGERLVVVQTKKPGSIDAALGPVNLSFRWISMKSWTSIQTGTINLSIAWPSEIKPPPQYWHSGLVLFEGHPDPRDSSHFTVDFNLGGQSGVIDGWLTTNDAIAIVVRGGPGTSPSR